MDLPVCACVSVYVLILVVVSIYINFYVCLCVLGARGEPEGAASVASEGEQRGAPAGDPQRPGPLHTPL